MTKTYKISFLRILWHIPFLIAFVILLVLVEDALVLKSESIFLIVLLGLAFMALIVPMAFLFVQYFREDWNKTVEIKDNQLTIRKGSYVREINLMTDIISSTSTKAGGFRNPLTGYGFFQFNLTSGETFWITSLTANPEKVANYFKKPSKELTIGFPRLGLNVDGKGEELAETLTANIHKYKDKIQKETFDANVSGFVKKFENKSIEELETIVLKNELADYAIEASRILIQRKTR